jgi:hypothetical protein
MLEDFLETVEPLASSRAEPPKSEADFKREQAQIKHVLRVADFLFGSTLEKALNTLDSSIVKSFKSVPSGRRIFLVKPERRNGASTKQNEDATNYICFLPQSCREAQQQQQQQQQQGFYFCSCPSFFQKTKSLNVGCCAETRRNVMLPFSLCKHLLALKLLPYLGAPCSIVEDVTEDNFSQHIVKELLGRQGGSYDY